MEKEMQEIMKAAMTKAAASFSRITGRDILTESIETSMVKSFDGKLHANRPDSYIAVLVTALIGCISGRSYLLLTKKDISCIMESMTDSGNTITPEFEEAVLKELDNILSAAVITELGNRFRTDVFGDVPELYHMTSAAAEHLIGTPGEEKHFFTKSTFVCKGLEYFAPKFIWKISQHIREVKED
jgi:chemotaxis protein CheY-P-specific phosphatase CheC